VSVSGTRLAVIVVNYGSVELIRQNLVELGRTLQGGRIVVVDNFSTASNRAAVIALAEEEDWDVVLPGDNAGFGRGMNLGVAAARERGAERFLLLNPDAVIASTDVDTMVARSERDPLAVLTPRILRPDGTLWSAGSDLYLDDGRIRSRRRRLEGARLVPWLSGACLMISAGLWERVGGFDEGYFLYWEDVDLSWRVVQAGGTLEVAEDAVAVHAQGGTQATAAPTTGAAANGAESAGNAKSSTYYRYNIRNRMLFASRHLDDAGIRAWRRQSRRVAWEILLQGGRRQFLSSPGTLLVGFRALREGQRLASSELRRRRLVR
jgi:GT2 family glycosyltransferase